MGAHARVLVVDDQNFNLVAIAAQVESLGIKCDIAITGKDAVNLIRQRIDAVMFGQVEMYELILQDYCMPEMDGLETAQAVRRALAESTENNGNQQVYQVET